MGPLAHLHEVWQETIPAPSRIAQSFPGIEVVRPSAIPAHGIEDAAPTKDFPLRHWSSSTIELCLWHGNEIPVVNAANVSSNVDRVLDD